MKEDRKRWRGGREGRERHGEGPARGKLRSRAGPETSEEKLQNRAGRDRDPLDAGQAVPPQDALHQGWFRRTTSFPTRGTVFAAGSVLFAQFLSFRPNFSRCTHIITYIRFWPFSTGFGPRDSLRFRFGFAPVSPRFPLGFASARFPWVGSTSSDARLGRTLKGRHAGRCNAKVLSPSLRKLEAESLKRLRQG